MNQLLTFEHIANLNHLTRQMTSTLIPFHIGLVTSFEKDNGSTISTEHSNQIYSYSNKKLTYRFTHLISDDWYVKLSLHDGLQVVQDNRIYYIWNPLCNKKVEQLPVHKCSLQLCSDGRIICFSRDSVHIFDHTHKHPTIHYTWEDGGVNYEQYVGESYFITIRQYSRQYPDRNYKYVMERYIFTHSSIERIEQLPFQSDKERFYITSQNQIFSCDDNISILQPDGQFRILCDPNGFLFNYSIVGHKYIVAFFGRYDVRQDFFVIFDTQTYKYREILDPLLGEWNDYVVQFPWVIIFRNRHMHIYNIRKTYHYIHEFKREIRHVTALSKIHFLIVVGQNGYILDTRSQELTKQSVIFPEKCSFDVMYFQNDIQKFKNKLYSVLLPFVPNVLISIIQWYLWNGCTV
jgi:hypothetical protein